MPYIVLFLVLILTLPPAAAIGQIDPGGGVDVGGGGDAGGGLTGDGGFEPAELDLGTNTEDTRNQGFVGATATGIQELGFVGASSETSGPPLSEGATFGGDINNSGVQAGGGGGGATGGNPGGAGGGGGFNGGFGDAGQLGGGTENGFQVIRSSVRARLVPRINAPPIPGEQIVSRFQDRFSRQPVPQPAGPPFSDAVFSSVSTSGVNVQVQNRTAILTGFVGSLAERNRWERQLRLEPGVYQIINQIEVIPNGSSNAR
jgi:hypothetical protein